MNDFWEQGYDVLEQPPPPLIITMTMANLMAMKEELREKDVEIESLKILLSDCLDCFEHTPTRPIAVAIKQALKGNK